MKNMLKRTIYIILFLLMNGLPINANLISSLDHVNRLINSHVNKIYQDKKGYIWIGTNNGLSRFDGSNIKTYYHIFGDSTSIATNAVLTVLEDSNNKFWVGTTAGLQLFDRNTEKFENIAFSYPHINDFSYVNCIIEDRKGNIWISTGRAGAICLQAKTYRPTYYLPTNSNICSNIINSIFEDRYGNIWIGSQDKGVSVLNLDNNVVVNYKHDSGNANSLSSNKIFSISETPDGNILIGSIDAGIDLFDYSSRTITRQYIPDSHLVFTMMTDKNENLWIGTDGDGIKLYNYKNKQAVKYDSYSPNIALDKAKIHSLLQDTQGNIWVGVYQKSIVLIPPFNKTFNTLGYNPFYKEKSIGQECVLSILEDQNQHLWIGTDGDGIYRLDEKKNLYQHYDISRLGGKSIVTIFQDSKKRIWVGTYLSGMYLYNPSNDKFELENLYHNGLKVTDINILVEDEDNNLWIGTNSNGVCIYNPDTKEMKWLQYDIKKTANQLLSNSIHTIMPSKNNKVWIGTSTAGLSCYDIQTGSFEDYTVSNGRVSNSCINKIVAGHDGNLWVGTKTGLNYIDLETGQTSVYTEKDGFISSSINAIEIDNENNLWISTEDGLSFFDTRTKTITNHEMSDRMMMNGEFKRNANYQLPSGELFFGGVGGVVYFTPFRDVASRPILDLYFTDLYVYNKRVEADLSKHTPIKQNIEISNEINFNYDVKSFSIGFSAIEYNEPDKIIYQTKMEGFEDEWKTIPTENRLATFTNLPAGNYTFKVRAFLEKTSPIERSIAITIHPPLWLTWWAKVLYVLISLFFIYCIYKIIQSKNEKKKDDIRKEGEAQIMQSKLEFFTDISHEIRTPLTLILTPVEQLLKKEKDVSLLSIYKLINQNGLRILRLINQTMDMKKIDRKQVKLDTEKIAVSPFIEEIAHAFDYIAQEKNIEFGLNISKDIPQLWVDKDILDKVLVNVLSNAFKYTNPDGKITIDVDIVDRMLNICITDSGIGIPPEQRESVFHRFYRISNDNNITKTGTGIGLHISQSLMKIHFGSISIADTPTGEGTSFVIQIPTDDIRLGIKNK